MNRSSTFVTSLWWIVTGYLVIATVILHQTATTPADDAVARLVGVLTGAAGLVAFCLLMRWAEELPPRVPDASADAPADAPVDDGQPAAGA